MPIASDHTIAYNAPAVVDAVKYKMRYTTYEIRE